MRQINAAGRELIKSFEGCRLEAYRDCVGVLTIGYGSTGPHVKQGMIITPEQADELLTKDLSRFEQGVEVITEGCPTSDNEFAALTSLGFNIGLGRLATSTTIKKHRAGDKLAAANGFILWRKAGGNVLPGLVKRREAERALYLTP